MLQMAAKYHVYTLLHDIQIILCKLSVNTYIFHSFNMGKLICRLHTMIFYLKLAFNDKTACLKGTPDMGAKTHLYFKGISCETLI